MAKDKKDNSSTEIASIFEEEEIELPGSGTENDDEEFNRLLNDFIASELKDIDTEIEEKKEEIAQNVKTRHVVHQPPERKEAAKPAKPSAAQSPAQTASQPQTASQAPAIAKPAPAPQPEKSKIILQEEEEALFSAFQNFRNAIETMADQFKLKAPKFAVTEELLSPRYKPKVSAVFTDATLDGWDIILKAHGADLKDLKPDAGDDDILNFAEKEEDETLQLALISYVEVLIEIESCEIAYESRRIKAKKRWLEKKIIEEHEARQAKIKKYIALIEEQKFPINSERLVINYFKTARKDPDGAREILITNPATYSPIEVAKIPPRLFGLIKSKPEDGIKFNRIIGNFLKKLKA